MDFEDAFAPKPVEKTLAEQKRTHASATKQKNAKQTLKDSGKKSVKVAIYCYILFFKLNLLEIRSYS